MDNDTVFCNNLNLTTTNQATPDVMFVQSTRFWIQRILTPIVVFIGIIGNIVTIAVLTQRRMKSSTNTYLTALAVSDLIYLICFFLLSLQHYTGINDAKYYFYWRILPYVYWYTDTSSNTSLWLTVSFTLERYVAVCYPLRGHVFCTESRARKVIGCVSIFNVLATVSTTFEWEVCRRSNTELQLQKTEFGENAIYKAIYYWFSAFAFVFIPLSLLCVFNSLLIGSVRRSEKQRNNLTQAKHGGISSRERQENTITRALVVIVLFSIFCQIPTTTLLIVSVFYDPLPDTAGYNYSRAFGNIFNFFVCINAATNFLLYCAMSDKYRRTFMMTFISCISKHRRQFTISSLASYRSSVRGSVRMPAATSCRTVGGSVRRPPEQASYDPNTLRPPSIQY